MHYPLFLSAIHYGLAQQAAAETPSCRLAVGSARALKQSLQATQVPPRSPPKLQRSHLNTQGNHLHTRGDGEQASGLQKHPFNPWVWMKRGVNQWPNCSSSGWWKREGEEAPAQGSMLLHTGLIPKEVNSVLYSEVGPYPWNTIVVRNTQNSAALWTTEAGRPWLLKLEESQATQSYSANTKNWKVLMRDHKWSLPWPHYGAAGTQHRTVPSSPPYTYRWPKTSPCSVLTSSP